MPIIRIEALAELPADLLASTAQAAATALGTEPERVWVAYRRLEEACYYEGGQLRGAADARVVAPLVTLSLRVGRSDAALRAALRAIAEAVGHALGVDPDLVFVECREIPEGRVHTGGGGTLGRRGDRLMATVRYETGCDWMELDKAFPDERFFDLKTRLASS